MLGLLLCDAAAFRVSHVPVKKCPQTHQNNTSVVHKVIYLGRTISVTGALSGVNRQLTGPVVKVLFSISLPSVDRIHSHYLLGLT